MEYSPCSLRNTQTTTTVATNFRATVPYRNLPYMKYVEDTNLEEHCPQNKRAKIDHVNDFLHQISFITSPEDVRIRNVKYAAGLDNENNDVTVSPLLRKFVDLRFSQISYAGEGKVHPATDNVDDSAAFNDMSLDKIIDAILDTTAGSEQLELRNSSNNHLQNENEQNQIHEDNLINIVQEKQLTYTLENSPNIDEKDLVDKSVRDLTPDDDINKRKRSSVSLCEERNDSKRRNVDNVEGDTDTSFALKRQKCVRRRRPATLMINNNICRTDMECDKMTNTPVSVYKQDESTSLYKERFNDNSFSSSCVFEKSCTVTKSQNLDQNSMLSQQLDCLGYSPWRKEICCGLSTPSLQHFETDCVFKGKRPLKRSVSDADGMKPPMSGTASSTPTRRDRDLSAANGYIDLQVSYDNGVLSINVVRCRDLQRSSGGPVNAYVKVALLPDSGKKSKKRLDLQRTAVQADSADPQFDQKFTFLLTAIDSNHRILLEVWHRERTERDHQDNQYYQRRGSLGRSSSVGTNSVADSPNHDA
ncbi:Protostome-specific GEF [Carabus blaptoides fortunei]